MPTEVKINVDMGKPCPRCKKPGAANGGPCLKCRLKALESGEYDERLRRLRREKNER